MEVIQNLILPGDEFNTPKAMYVRLAGLVSCNSSKRALSYQAGGCSSFDTYFNSISIEKLRRITVIDKLYINFCGRGRFVLRVGVHCLNQPKRWLTEKNITLPFSSPLSLPWEGLTEGMLYIALEALEDAELTGGEFLTSTPPTQDVKLGVVITHFNRQSFVVPAISRIRKNLLNQPDLFKKIELIVVDNSNNLTAAQAEGAVLLPNQNYGGSGGFTRGLLHLIDNNFTHCLFMDDDATCEIDSIRRTYALQRFAKNDRTAIAGALLREQEPHILDIKGGYFENGRWKGLHHNQDVLDVENLLAIEQVSRPCDYGAWWFFCFKIEDVKSFPFPFFVRADDILFSLMNKFNIETLNGISCWGEDFSFKEGPFIRYFDMRSRLVLMLQATDISRIKTGWIILYKLFDCLLSYNYSSTATILDAVADVGKGPKFWADNIDTANIRAKLAPLSAAEKMSAIKIEDYKLADPTERKGIAQYLMRVLTMNAALLPNFLLRNEMVLDKKDWHANYARVFRFKQILYYHAPTKQGYVATLNQRQFFSKLFKIFFVLSGFLYNLPKLRKAYREAMPRMTSESFWRGVYQDKGK